MATVFFARIGSDPNRADPGIEVPMSSVLEHLSGLDRRYTNEPPVIADETGKNSSPYGAPTQSVVEIEAGDVSPQFPKPGYYWFPGLAPERCRALLGLAAPD